MSYRSGERLRPSVVRVTSAVLRRRFRGPGPDEVYEFLRLVATEVERLQREATAAQTTAERAREGLRQWRVRHIGCTFADPPADRDRRTPPHQRPGTGRRPVDTTDQDQQPRNGGHW